MTNPDTPSQQAAIDRLVDNALKLIKPVNKVESGTGLKHMDSVRLLLRMDITELLQAAATQRAIEARYNTANAALKACPHDDKALRKWLQQHLEQLQSQLDRRKQSEGQV